MSEFVDMEEWKEYKLGEVCVKIGSGATPKGGKEAYLGGDISLIRSQNVLDFTFSNEGLAYINEEQADKLIHDLEKLTEITNSGIKIDMVVTHTSPSFAFNTDKKEIKFWRKYEHYYCGLR